MNKEKVAILTAAGTGMGADAARKLLSDGFKISILSSSGKGEALAKELGPRGIRVNAVCPVYVQTPGLLNALQDIHAPPLGTDVTQYLETFTEGNSALSRLPSGNEVAKACIFLASQESSAITGQCINVDCGVLPQ